MSTQARDSYELAGRATPDARRAPCAAGVWTLDEWRERERRVRAAALRANTEREAWRALVREARAVMRSYTTSFFIVSRFLPRGKRDEVEAVYAAVRYPDEVVDTFPVGAAERLGLLDEWAEHYEAGIGAPSLAAALRGGVPAHLAGFARVVRERAIPAEHYRDFLAAMRLDVTPRPFASLADLIDSYVYGSAVVVGYFLAHVYGADGPANFPRALHAARDLGVALQLTNFLRDVADDERRGRVYLPQDFLRDEGVARFDARDEAQQAALARVVRRVAGIAEGLYQSAHRNLDAFAPDCRLAIHSCIRVYGRLNERIAAGGRGVRHRESVPLGEKFVALPPSKYWRIPLAYLMR